MPRWTSSTRPSTPSSEATAPTNSQSLLKFYRGVVRIWRKWLNRRTRGNRLTESDIPSSCDFIRCCRLGSAMPGCTRRVLLEEPAAGNLHGGVCEGGDIPVVPWST